MLSQTVIYENNTKGLKIKYYLLPKILSAHINKVVKLDIQNKFNKY